MPIEYYIFLCLTLFSIGVIGVLTRRNAIIVFMCIELMLNAVNMLLVAFSKMNYATAQAITPNTTAGIDAQIFVFFIMVVAAAEVSIGLAIIVMIYRNIHSIDINFLNRLKKFLLEAWATSVTAIPLSAAIFSAT
jgi:NADH-quinone oxidoreductase subunit K